MRKWLAACGGLAIAAILLAPETGFGQDVEISSKALKIDIGGRVQMQARRSSCSAFPVQAPCTEEVQTVNWFIRRARIEFTVKFTDFIEGKFAPEFVPGSRIENAPEVVHAGGPIHVDAQLCELEREIAFDA